MGDRVVISNKNKKLGIYLHWYGYREFVESLLAYCDAKNYRSPDVDDEYDGLDYVKLLETQLVVLYQ